MNRLARSIGYRTRLPPSLPALATGWTPNNKVAAAVASLLWRPRDLAAEGRALVAKAEVGPAIVHMAFVLIVPTRPPGLPDIVAKASAGRFVRVVGLPELVAEVPRARALLAVLGKAERCGGKAP